MLISGPLVSRAAVVLVAVLAVTACTPAAATAPPDNDGAPAVEWHDYDASVQARIDELAREGDCRGLQEQFDIAEATGPATFARVGHNNANLMRYIDVAMQGAGCY